MEYQKTPLLQSQRRERSDCEDLWCLFTTLFIVLLCGISIYGATSNLPEFHLPTFQIDSVAINQFNNNSFSNLTTNFVIAFTIRNDDSGSFFDFEDTQASIFLSNGINLSSVSFGSFSLDKYNNLLKQGDFSINHTYTEAIIADERMNNGTATFNFKLSSDMTWKYTTRRVVSWKNHHYIKRRTHIVKGQMTVSCEDLKVEFNSSSSTSTTVATLMGGPIPCQVHCLDCIDS